MSELICSKVVMTRKEHSCFGCLRKFPAGTIMERFTAKEDFIFTDYICETCQGIARTQLRGEEFREGDLRDRALEWESDLPAADAGKGD